MLDFLKPQSALPLTGITEVAEEASPACDATVLVEEGTGPTFTCGVSTGPNAWKRFRTQTGWPYLARPHDLQVICSQVLRRSC